MITGIRNIYKHAKFLDDVNNNKLDVFFMEQPRPLDSLNNSRDKRVIVELKNGKQYIGKLRSFDIHINVVLEDVEERINGELTRKLGNVFIRGDMITTISLD